jgi:N-acetylglucosaminyldiphosphoundecaprenol N-acetyl-beta-D-mannosaminyltransferase
VDLILTAVQQHQKGYVCVTGVHGVVEAQRDPIFRDILSRAFLVTPDGMPTVWMGQMQGHSQMRRVYGPDLMLEICSRSRQTGIRHFFYGGNPGVAEDLAANLQRMYPGIIVAGTFTPPFRALEPSELKALVREMDATRPDILWVGLSTPKQEKFMATHIQQLPCQIMIGVGAAFDIHTGRISDAPTWVKGAGMQWAHRLYQEPRRLWKRYLVNNFAFLTAVTQQLIGIRRYPLPSIPADPPPLD